MAAQHQTAAVLPEPGDHDLRFPGIGVEQVVYAVRGTVAHYEWLAAGKLRAQRERLRSQPVEVSAGEILVAVTERSAF